MPSLPSNNIKWHSVHSRFESLDTRLFSKHRLCKSEWKQRRQQSVGSVTVNVHTKSNQIQIEHQQIVKSHCCHFILNVCCYSLQPSTAHDLCVLRSKCIVLLLFSFHYSSTVTQTLGKKISRNHPLTYKYFVETNNK